CCPVAATPYRAYNRSERRPGKRSATRLFYREINEKKTRKKAQITKKSGHLAFRLSLIHINDPTTPITRSRITSFG
ncbi:hypothetical protein ACVGWW_16890, partial [Enterobacter hormaechei]